MVKISYIKKHTKYCPSGCQGMCISAMYNIIKGLNKINKSVQSMSENHCMLKKTVHS